MEKIEGVYCGFAQRLFALRTAKGVSAREMSLSLGQGAGYVNNLENGHNLPSMAQFFAMCGYLGVTPSEFFSFESAEEEGLARLSEAARALESEDLEMLINLAWRLRRKDNRHGRN